LPHDDDELGLDDVDLACEPLPRLLLVRARELEAVRPVDRHRVDLEAAAATSARLPGAAEEGDALVLLRRLRPVLEQEEVGLRMAGAEHRRAVRACLMGDLAAEIVDLGDRLLEVAL
jgi:hypothetical protein